MKCILTLFAMLFNVSLFACDGVVHETLNEVSELYSHGFVLEARDLLNELAFESIHFTESEVVCFNAWTDTLNLSPMAWSCSKCPYYTTQKIRPSKCPNCGNSGTFYKGVLTKR